MTTQDLATNPVDGDPDDEDTLPSKLDQLFADFPTLYGVADHPFVEAGFQCGVGWIDIIRDLSQGLMKELPTDEHAPRFLVQNVASVDGCLRFDVDFPSAKIAAMIDDAERRSGSTCETCGAEGVRQKRDDGGFKTTCSSC